MATLTTETISDVLREDLEVDLGKDFQVGLTDVKCLAPTQYRGRRQCGESINKHIIVRIQAILNLPVTYLEGDKVKIFDAIDQLATYLVHPRKHPKVSVKTVNELKEKYRKTMERHFEAKKNDGAIVAITESRQVLENSDVEEDSLPVVPSSYTEEITQAVEVGEVCYPALPTTHTCTIEDKEDVTIDSSDEPHLLSRSNDTPPYCLAKPSTPLSSNDPMLSHPISKPLPSNNLLLLLVLKFLQQLYWAFASQVHVRWGPEPVEHMSGQSEHESFTEMKFFFGLRVATRLLPILLCVVSLGLYYQAGSILGCLAIYVLVSGCVSTLSRLRSPGSELVV
ncbi:hypothetical protein PEBR_06314 [Penicillium brasilianum]|uniref:Uncharacterized protein n=1 Tax=Penicillium brasilianum TaxID=104259 RepID=A0A1S9RXS3_PENBI|nr:hypothetical protein PEBR_06314 [Penicillium brasilianum]